MVRAVPNTALAKALAEKGRLVPCQAVAGAALAGENLPARIKLFNWGANERIDGPPIIVGDRTLSSLSANQAALGFDRIIVDYNHQSLPGHPNFKPDPREHAAFGGVEVVKDDGIYCTALAWTPSGETNARNYPDLSPTPLLDENNEVVFLHSVALCTQGKLKSSAFVSALSAQFLAPLSTLAPSPKPEKSKSIMDPKKLLCAILGLDPATATDDEIATAAEKFGKEEKTEPDAAVTALSADVKRLTTLVEGSERAAALDAALRAGKLVPQSVAALPLESMKAVIADLPEGVVPLAARTPEGIGSAAAVTALSATDKAVAAQLGLSEEDFKAA
jgi:phage I-like protein